LILKTKLFGNIYEFSSVKEVLAKANEHKSGDVLAGVAASTTIECVAAKIVLAQLTVSDIRNNPVATYEEDEITRVIQDSINECIYGEMKNWTISELREYILQQTTTDLEIQKIRRGLTSEVVAAVCKLMSNMDLIQAAKKITIEAHCNTTIGKKGTLASRLQPNHTTDDPKGVMLSMMEGLTFGVGDAVIGLNPVDDSLSSLDRILRMFDEFKHKWEVPSQFCVLGHVATQIEAINQGTPIDLCFQSISGSAKGNEAFGMDVKMLDEAYGLMLKRGTSTGPNVMYFETGQGSELSAEGHHGADQVTMEARCYGLAKRYNPYIVNTVVGFIGPEYLYNSKQVIRAGLEDHFMGKLTGISMGCDACYTNHMKADQNDIENLSILLGAAGCTYFMGIPSGDDIMLNYQSTGFHDIATIRDVLGLKPIKEFEDWSIKHGFLNPNGTLGAKAGDASVFMK